MLQNPGRNSQGFLAVLVPGYPVPGLFLNRSRVSEQCPRDFVWIGNSIPGVREKKHVRITCGLLGAY
eukprot:1473078-Rhodomonas_salina.1